MYIVSVPGFFLSPNKSISEYNLEKLNNYQELEICPELLSKALSTEKQGWIINYWAYEPLSLSISGICRHNNMFQKHAFYLNFVNISLSIIVVLLSVLGYLSNKIKLKESMLLMICNSEKRGECVG